MLSMYTLIVACITQYKPDETMVERPDSALQQRCRTWEQDAEQITHHCGSRPGYLSSPACVLASSIRSCLSRQRRIDIPVFTPPLLPGQNMSESVQEVNTSERERRYVQQCGAHQATNSSSRSSTLCAPYIPLCSLEKYSGEDTWKSLQAEWTTCPCHSSLISGRRGAT